MKLVLQQSTQLPLRSFRQLGRDLGIAHPVCTENPIRVDDVTESPKLAE
jgi:hypothetical protein